MGCKHQAVFTSRRSNSSATSPKILKCILPGVDSVSPWSALPCWPWMRPARAPRRPVALIRGIQQELHPPWKSTWNPLSFYLQLWCFFNRGYTPITSYYTLNIPEQDDPPKWIWNMILISPSMAYPLRTLYDDILYRNSWAITPAYLSLNNLQVPVHSQWRWGDVHPVQRRNHWSLASTVGPTKRPVILSGMSG